MHAKQCLCLSFNFKQQTPSNIKLSTSSLIKIDLGEICILSCYCLCSTFLEWEASTVRIIKILMHFLPPLFLSVRAYVGREVPLWKRRRTPDQVAREHNTHTTRWNFQLRRPDDECCASLPRTPLLLRKDKLFRACLFLFFISLFFRLSERSRCRCTRALPGSRKKDK